METEFPWTWRLTRPNREKPTWKDVLKYRKWIQLMLKNIRVIDQNRDLYRICADCGLTHRPQGPLNRDAPHPFTVGFANPMLGVLLCPDCANCHKEVLPPSLSRILYIFYDLHEWSLDDVAQLARWGNLRSQRYWLSKYRTGILKGCGIMRPAATEMTRKDWIIRKYVNREWAMDKIPHDRLNLYHYNPCERKVFAILKQINWCPPKSHSFIANDTTTKPNSRSSRSPAPDHETLLKRATNVSRSEPISCTTENCPVALSPGIFASKDFPRISVDVHRRSSKNNNSNNGSSANCFAKSSSIHYSDDSDYSDDLYGTGRPLRPSLINSDQRVQEWQLSAQGNPEVTVFLPDTFQPDSREEISVKNHELTAFLESESQASVTSKYVKPPPSPNQLDKNPSVFDDLAVLITVDEPTEASIVVDEEEVSIGNDTITEEDTSILADLDAGFAEEIERGSAGLDYRCLSDDDDTEIDSELDKIEYEFQPVQPVSMDEMKILSSEMEKPSTDNEPLEMVPVDAKVNAGGVEENLKTNGPSDPKLMEVASKGDETMEIESTDGRLQPKTMEDIFESPNSRPAVDVEEMEYQGSQKSTPIHELDKNDVCSSHESQPPSQREQSKETASIELSLLPPTATTQESSKSASFAKIILAKPSDRIKNQPDKEEKNDAKEGLVDFLLRSGLFSAG